MISRLPIVSVVVPMYNVEKYIETCIQSVLAQTFRHYEIICVDDGCTDNTLQILDQFNDHRIKLVRQKNRGLSGARNTGIHEAKGIYIALLDADDFWHPDKLSIHVTHLNNNPEIGISYSPSIFVDDDNNQLGIGQFPQIKHIDSKTIFCRNPVGNGSAAVVRRQLLLKMGQTSSTPDRFMVFDESLKQSEDIELWIRISLSSHWKFEGVETALTYYRVNSSGLSANLEKQFKSWKRAVDKNRPLNPDFFKRYFSLSNAYQLRYLARRAIQSGNSLKAISLVNKALATNILILFEEPRRTVVTYICSLLSLLPSKVYRALESTAMTIAAKWRQHNLNSNNV